MIESTLKLEVKVTRVVMLLTPWAAVCRPSLSSEKSERPQSEQEGRNYWQQLVSNSGCLMLSVREFIYSKSLQEAKWGGCLIFIPSLS